jgi:oligopeptide transport system ATP-binding protein
VLEQHRGSTRATALAEAQRMLDAVRVSDPARRLQQYPHELSGGMRQRVMIAMSLLTRPRLLIADEPTTALDVTVQAQILRLLAELRRDLGLAVLLITHDLSLVAELCDRSLVLYAGRLVEQGRTAELLSRPRHPYTAALLRARPRLDSRPGEPLASITGQAPDPRQPLAGCAFAPRCAQADAACIGQEPPLQAVGQGQHRCWRPLAG